MKLLKNFNNLVKGKHSEGLMLVGVFLVVLIAINAYSNNKGIFPEYMTKSNSHANEGDNSPQAPSSVTGAAGDDLTADHYAVVPPSGGRQSGSALPPSCSKKTSFDDPKELLPKQGQNKFSALQPTTNDLQGVNLLQAGYHIGVDTVGQSLRNANLQLRSEPANPQTAVSPWMNSTMEPDLQRKPLEIGCKC
jgi:hypothetical protein